jgi:hypothetical protein
MRVLVKTIGKRTMAVIMMVEVAEATVHKRTRARGTTEVTVVPGSATSFVEVAAEG